jgi:iron complex outermembrane receptor protein
MNRSRVLGVLLCALVSSPLRAAAQDPDSQVDEVVVTATKRRATAQDIPFSLNVQTQQDLERAGVSNIEDLSKQVGGLSVQNLGPGQSQVAIRGVSAGQIVRDQPGVKEQVGIYLDESVISLSLFTPDFDLYDLDRVETLRGPQGTLFGSGSVGGTLRYITHQPDPSALHGSLELNANHLTQGDLGGHLKGMLNVPLAPERAALRLVGYTNHYAGFVDALSEGGTERDVNDGTNNGVRAALRWQPTDRWTVTPRIVYQELAMDGFNRQEAFNLFANPFTTARPAVRLGEWEQFLRLNEAFEDRTLLADVTLEADLGRFALTSVSSFTDREILVSRDASTLTGSISLDRDFPEAAALLPSNLRDTTDVQRWTQEIRLSDRGGEPFQWLVGAFYSRTEREYAQRLPTPGYDAITDAVLGPGTAAGAANGYPADSPFNSDLPYELDELALFGELTLDLTDALHVTLGGRYYDFAETRKITTGGLFAAGDRGAVGETDSRGFNPRVIAAFDLTPEVTLNAQIAKGVRLGGVNDPLNTPLCSPGDLGTFGGFQAYGDETLWNYELGMKGQFDRGIAFQLSAFRAEIEDLQVTLDAGSCSSRISFNVAEAHSTGIEFDLTAQATPGLRLGFSGSYVRSEFADTVRAASGAVLGGVADGNRLASVPGVQLAASATYSVPTRWLGGAELFVSGGIQYVGERFTQPGDQIRGAGRFASGLPFAGASGNEITDLDLELDAYTLLNLRAGFSTPTWETTVYIDNLTNQNANLSFDRERGGRARLAFHSNRPRTVGITYRRFF